MIFVLDLAPVAALLADQLVSISILLAHVYDVSMISFSNIDLPCALCKGVDSDTVRANDVERH